jgi:hypothetical protein
VPFSFIFRMGRDRQPAAVYLGSEDHGQNFGYS